VVEEAERELQSIRALLTVPTPDNFQAVKQKFGSLVRFLSSLETSLTSGQDCDRPMREFVMRLPAEVARLRILLEAPIDFYRGLNESRAPRFGSYDQNGKLKQLEGPAGTFVRL
jgi:hypothetical protein